MSSEHSSVSVEVFMAPIEDSINGAFVCNASSSGIGLIKEPIKIEFKDGKAIK